MRPFLRAAFVNLYATTARAPVGPDAWLDPGPQGRDEVLLALREDSEEAGVVGLTCIDWLARSARLCAGGRAVAPAELAEALALVARYAFEELNLERVEALPTRPEARALLVRAGLDPSEGAGLHVARRADGRRPR